MENDHFGCCRDPVFVLVMDVKIPDRFDDFRQENQSYLRISSVYLRINKEKIRSKSENQSRIDRCITRAFSAAELACSVIFFLEIARRTQYTYISDSAFIFLQTSLRIRKTVVNFQ